MDTLDFLDGPTPENTAAPEPAPAPAPVENATPTDGQPRGPDGKFAPKGPTEAAPAVLADPAAPAPAIPPVAEPTQQAPIDPRVAELEKQVAGLTKALTTTRQERRQVQPAPDPYEDLEAYQAYQQEREMSLRADYSFKLFAATNGEEKAKAVADWAFQRAESDPAFNERAIQAQDPFSFAAEEYEQHQTLQMLRDPTLREKFQAFMSGQAPAAQPAAPALVVATPPQPSPPPRSLASAPNAGGAKPGAQPAGPGVAFDTTFKE